MSEHKQDIEFSIKEIIFKIKNLIYYLISKWKIIVIIVLIGAFLGLLYSLNQKPIYTAVLTFVLEDEKQGGASFGGTLANQFGLEIGGGNAGGMFSGANLNELFKSRRIVEQTLLTTTTNRDGKIISLAELFLINNKWRKNWENNTKMKNIHFSPKDKRENFTRIQDSILGEIFTVLSNKEKLQISQKNIKTGIISVETKSENELFAKIFTEALAQEVSDFYIETKSKKARINLSILQRQTDSIRMELYNSITGVAIANDNTFALNPALNIHRTTSTRREISVSANTAILNELVKETELAKVSVRKSTPLIQIIDRPIFPLEKQIFGKLKGILFGGIISTFLVIFLLVVIRFFKQLSKIE
jgi:hypothetical protein